MRQPTKPTAFKGSQIYPPCDKMCDIIVFCYIHHISLYIGVDVPLNKQMWEHKMHPDIEEWMNVIKECGESDLIREDDEEELPLLKELLASFADACEKNGSMYFYVFTCKTRLFYDISQVRTLPDDRMWKTEFLSPSYVNKEVLAEKEPVTEIARYIAGITLNTAEVFDDVDEIYQAFGELD